MIRPFYSRRKLLYPLRVPERSEFRSFSIWLYVLSMRFRFYDHFLILPLELFPCSYPNLRILLGEKCVLLTIPGRIFFRFSFIVTFGFFMEDGLFLVPIGCTLFGLISYSIPFILLSGVLFSDFLFFSIFNEIGFFYFHRTCGRLGNESCFQVKLFYFY